MRSTKARDRRPIRILGAGPAGLAAAITIARAGRMVEVLERRSRCAARFNGDLQGLENWTDAGDVVAELRSYGLEINFSCEAVAEATQTNGRRSDLLRFPRPAFYLVERGAGEGALDQGLLRQALDAGVRVRFGAGAADGAAPDVVATGPRRAALLASGIVFRTSHEDLTAVLLNDRAAVRGYSYLLISHGHGCLCSTMFADFPSTGARLAEARAFFERRIGFDIHDERAVGGFGAFAVEPTYARPASPGWLIGEAAGLQDFLWGFGIRTAIRSGVLAGKALLEELDYPALARQQFSSAVRCGVVNRFLWDALRVGDYRLLLFAFRRGGPLDLMLAMHRESRLQRLLFPLASRYVRSRYPGVALTPGGALTVSAKSGKFGL